MEYNKKKILMMISLSLFSIAIISLGTYAIWTSANDLLTGTNTIQSGQVKMSYTETNEIGMTNALPIKDSEGKVLTNYFDFQVLSYIKTRANDDTQRKVNYNIVLEPLTVDNPLSDNEIKVYLTKVENGVETVVVEPTTIDQLNSKVLKSQEEIFSNNKAEVVTSYRLRAWIDSSVDTNKLNEKKYSYKFRVNINNEAAPVKKDYALSFAETNEGKGGLEKVTHEVDDTLQVDSKFATEYRYRGAESTVNNYVTFNNEIWRIIGILNTEDESGNSEYRFKLIRNESIGNMYWNDSQNNNWTTATINTYLNNDYYNTLSSDAKSMTGTTKYYLGSYPIFDKYNDGKEMISIPSSKDMWIYERKKANNETCVYTDGAYVSGDCYFFNTNPTNHINRIGLLYLSDFGYATDKCESEKLLFNDDYTSGKESDDISKCASVNWLYANSYYWSMNPEISTAASSYYFNGSSVQYFSTYYISSDKPIRPVLTLSSNVKISSGTGTSSDPYKLSQ